MRVLQLGKYYYPYMGGIENHLYLLCNELRTKVDLDVVVCNSIAKEERDVVDGVNVRRCLTAATVASTALCPTMPLALSRRTYDVLHVHFPHPMGVAAYLASRKPRRHRVVVTYHSDIVKQEKLLKAYAPLMNVVMDRADAIICTSPNYLASSATLQRYANKCVIVPYGIDISQFDVSRQVDDEAARIRRRFLGDGSASSLLLATGRLIYYKGFEFAVRAMARIKSDAQLVIVGDGPLRRSLETLARDVGVERRVHFAGEIDNRGITPYYRACDAFLLPSIARSEAFAIVQLEAMACERPVINTSLDSGVPFVSRHEESGLTVAPGDEGALAAAIDSILKNPERRRTFGSAGRRRVERDFTKEVMTRRILDVYGAAA